MKATKRIGCTLLALIFLLLAGCAAPPQAEADGSVSDFVFGEDGYAYAPAPFGSTRKELEAALGSEMIDKGSNPHTKPFEYLRYVTPKQDVQLSGPNLTSRVDAQFTEDDGLFAITFNSAVTPDQREDFVEACRSGFTALCGEPAEDTARENGWHILSWEDEESGTAFMVNIDGPTKFDEQEAEVYNVMLGAYEKWRYTEAGE